MTRPGRPFLVLLATFVWLSACGGTTAGNAGSPSTRQVDCRDYSECGTDRPCPDGFGCFAIDGCEAAICIDEYDVCDIVCGASNCAILESFPMQIACESG